MYGIPKKPGLPPPAGQKPKAPQPGAKEPLSPDKMKAQAQALRKRKPAPKVPPDSDMDGE